MKILHIASGSHGGAKLSANKLRDLQISNGVFSKMLELDRNNDYLSASLLKMILRKGSTLIQRLNTRQRYGIFSTRSIESINLSKLEKANFDVIQIHNWFNLLNPESLIKLSKLSKLVFTLHDERLISGGCHYTLECENFKNSCLRCPGVYLGRSTVSQNKKVFDMVFSQIGEYAVVAPSKWIINKAKDQSIISQSKIVRVIPNSMGNLIEIKPQMKRKRKQWELLFLASDISEPKKGLDPLLKSLDKISLQSKYEFHLNIVGKGDAPRNLRFPNTFHNFLSKEKLVKVLNKTDLCIIPSLADNLPSVIVEAIIHGNIVLASRAGGIMEVINHGKTGFLTEIDTESLSSSIVQIFNTPDDILKQVLKNSQNMVRNLYDPYVIHNAHLELYEDLLAL